MLTCRGTRHPAQPLSITLTGVTNDDVDPTVDTWRNATLPLLRKAGLPEEGLELKILKRGAVREATHHAPRARASPLGGPAKPRARRRRGRRRWAGGRCCSEYPP